jgi:phage regulator Rha-like protein
MKELMQMNQEQTMTSLELVEVIRNSEGGNPTLKHAKLIIAIDRLYQKGAISEPVPIEHRINNNTQEVKVYLLNKNDSIVVVAQNNPLVTAAIVKRWEELEAKQNKPLSQLDILANAVQVLQEQEQRITQVEHDLSETKQRLEQFGSDTGYLTVTAFLKREGKSLPLDKANAFGRKVGKVCRAQGITVGKVPDERFGNVNSYPIGILEDVFYASEK